MGYFDEAKEKQELAHHGILGQKWGVRRFQNKDGSLTAAGKARKKPSTKKPKHDFKDNSASQSMRKDYVKDVLSAYGLTAVGTAINAATVAGGFINPALFALTAASAVGSVGMTAGLAVRDIQSAHANKKEKKFKEERESEPIDKATGFHKKTREMTPDEDMARVNPAFKNWDQNTKNNCMLCTMSYELRRRGYDVQAKKATDGYSEDLVKDWFTGAKTKTSEGSLSNEEIFNSMFDFGGPTIDYDRKEKMISNTIKELKSQKEGSRGAIGVTWDGTTAGHEVAYAIENGEPVIYDTQANEKYVGTTRVELYLDRTSQITVTRLDNCKLNTKYIKEVAE